MGMTPEEEEIQQLLSEFDQQKIAIRKQIAGNECKSIVELAIALFQIIAVAVLFIDTQSLEKLNCHSNAMFYGDWSKLAVGDTSCGNTTKSFTTNSTEYNYKVLFDDADQYDFFSIDANLTNDAHIGFSAEQDHNATKWEIVIGGWNGTRSVVRSGNQDPIFGLVEQLHTKERFNDFKHNLKITVLDGQIQVYIENGDNLFMEWNDTTIVKSELTNLLVSGGWGGCGQWEIVGTAECFSRNSSYELCNE